MEIKMFDEFGVFGEDKDKAKNIRENKILPALNKGEDIILNFEGVKSVTQSFMHALISKVIREKGTEVLEKIYFKECNDVVKEIVRIVTEYMQDPIGLDEKNGIH
ncbi:STAS-like domain-containing protein [Candidatus Micrarchaeota archaeon]|nr:STAS-like domain-containing protein [Candidatus Micrarchaeota archaeon]MBU2476362.1 STAS-like domain-containing protein [Candidatus Micrarchaeota archaeon]